MPAVDNVTDENEEFDLESLGGLALDDVDPNADPADPADPADGEETEDQRIDRLANERAGKIADKLADEKLAERMRQFTGAPADATATEASRRKPVETYDPTAIRDNAADTAIVDTAVYMDQMQEAMDDLEREFGQSLSREEFKQVRAALRDIPPAQLKNVIAKGGHTSMADSLLGQRVRQGKAAAVRNGVPVNPVGTRGAAPKSESTSAIEKKFERDYGFKPNKKDLEQLRGIR